MPVKAHEGPKSSEVTLGGKHMLAISDNCTGCQLCQIACSWVKFQEFNPVMAFIDIQPDEAQEGRWDARFTGDCDACGYCSFFCHYDAIHLTRLNVPTRR